LPLCLIACRDGLGVPEGDPDLGNPDAGDACAKHTDVASCRADEACEAPTCDFCTAEPVFGGCYTKGTGPILTCPAIACAKDCSIHTTESACQSDTACTPVFADPGTCDCVGAGCCMAFTRCDSAPVQCSPDSIGPQCANSGIPEDCGPNYAPIFNGGCQIGCVRNSVCVSDCRTTGCGAGTHCDLCWTWTCLPDGETGKDC